MESKKEQTYSAKQILTQLDLCVKKESFIEFCPDNILPYITSRLTAYRDKTRWAILIEVIQYDLDAGGHHGIDHSFYVYGNCMNFEPGRAKHFIFLTSDSKNGPAFDIEYEAFLNPETKTMMLRGEEIALNHNRDYYEDKGIELAYKEEEGIAIYEFLRGLLPEHEAQMFATEEEIRELIPEDLPMFIQLSEWYHPHPDNDELPSNVETFKLLAKALETGQKELYKPTIAPNTHWKNWTDE